MKTLLFCLTFTMLTSCATKKPVVKRQTTWREKKRECHTYYMDRFGLKYDKAITVCKEELESNHGN